MFQCRNMPFYTYLYLNILYIASTIIHLVKHVIVLLYELCRFILVRILVIHIGRRLGLMLYGDIYVKQPRLDLNLDALDKIRQQLSQSKVATRVKRKRQHLIQEQQRSTKQSQMQPPVNQGPGYESSIQGNESASEQLHFHQKNYQKQDQMPDAIFSSLNEIKLSRKLLILDLDETLIHSASMQSSRSTRRRGQYNHYEYAVSTMSPELTIEITVNNHPILYQVYFRPHVIYFLQRLHQWYDLCIFTASVQQYADAVIDHIERVSGVKFLRHLQRFYREDCHIASTHPVIIYVKDLWHAVTKWNGSYARHHHHRHRRRLDIKQDGTQKPLASQSEYSSNGRKQQNQSHARQRQLTDDQKEEMMKRVILLDNSVNSMKLHPNNGLLIDSFITSSIDESLLDFLPVLEALRWVEDVRNIIAPSS
ncbi:hypothetical protein MIR68_002192 [Amoeboaphelidium protococcarum]|nr:hypothetical protein MIR68_002192 [Amoeboaphelidium protococcarum]